jgi:hypothetical protein
LLGLSGVILVMLSVLGSVGIFSALGVKSTLIIMEVIPFLVLAVSFLLLIKLLHDSSVKLIFITTPAVHVGDGVLDASEKYAQKNKFMEKIIQNILKGKNWSRNRRMIRNAGRICSIDGEDS